MSKRTYYQGADEHPWHLSVGAVLVNEKGEVCHHHFTDALIKGYWPDEGLSDFYLLMRETVHPNETLEEAVHRGLLEEFGAMAEIVDYIGSYTSTFEHKGVVIQKTTPYFLCKLLFQDETKRDASDIEGETVLEWHMPDFLIPKMKEQGIRYKRTDVDESEILERLKA